MADAKIRLCVDQPLGPGQSVHLNRDQCNYLFAVMRLKIGDRLFLFNGRDDEHLAEVVVSAKRNGVLACVSRSKPLQHPPDLWLLFAPLKKARTDFIVEKAVEMGAARILPVLTDFTNNDRIRQEKMHAHAIEAAEQCGATYVPQIDGPQKFSDVFDKWPEDRNLMFCDETLVGQHETIGPVTPGPGAILIGPEGGFSPAERERLNCIPLAKPVSLGPRILRADTAAVVALTLWQQAFGDW